MFNFAENIYFMIKKIIHCADIHVPAFRDLDKYSIQLDKFINKCAEITKDLQKNEIRIVLTGDIFHNKLQISNEQFSFIAAFIRNLEKIGTVIVISGNHDLLVNNLSRKDSLSALFDTAAFENSYFIDESLNYKSGIMYDNNVTWALYSIFSDYEKPDIQSAKVAEPNNLVIGLYHGTIIGATLNNGTVMENGASGDDFQGCDIVMCGHIHKRQEFKRGNALIVYPGSVIQQRFDETVTQHGFCVWDLVKNTHEYIDIKSDFELYDFSIKQPTDFDENKEKLLNY